MKNKGCDAAVSAMEKETGLLGIESNAKAMLYFIEKNSSGNRHKKLILATFNDGKKELISLTRSQAQTLSEEIGDICEMVWGKSESFMTVTDNL